MANNYLAQINNRICDLSKIGGNFYAQLLKCLLNTSENIDTFRVPDLLPDFLEKEWSPVT